MEDFAGLAQRIPSGHDCIIDDVGLPESTCDALFRQQSGLIWVFGSATHAQIKKMALCRGSRWEKRFVDRNRSGAVFQKPVAPARLRTYLLDNNCCALAAADSGLCSLMRCAGWFIASPVCRCWHRDVLAKPRMLAAANQSATFIIAQTGCASQIRISVWEGDFRPAASAFQVKSFYGSVLD